MERAQLGSALQRLAVVCLFMPLVGAAQAQVVFWVDEGAFDAAFPGLEVEDFEDGATNPGGVDCPTPIAALYPYPGSRCFPEGTLLPRLMVASRPDFNFTELKLWPAENDNPSQVVSLAVASMDLGLRLYFPGGERAVGFEIWGPMVGNFVVDVEVYGRGDTLLDSNPATGSIDGNFFGVSSSQDIFRIEIHSDDVIEGVDNVKFDADLIFRDGFESGDTFAWVCGDYDGDDLIDCGGDCDDGDPMVPGSLEICGDGRNNDCVGGTDDCCDPLAPVCASGEGCYPFVSIPPDFPPQSDCEIVGEDLGQGEECQFVNGCREGHGCVLLDLSNQEDFLCAYLCDANDDIPGCQDTEGPGAGFVCARLDDFYSNVSSEDAWGMCVPEDLTCDDTFCQPWESSATCPQDCP